MPKWASEEHRQQWIASRSRSPEDRFWPKVNRLSDNECWLWTATPNPNGYGTFALGGRLNKRMVLAHRYSWELLRGPIPDGLYVLHKCDVPACVNPNHLFLGTHADNMRDMQAKGRGASWGWARGRDPKTASWGPWAAHVKSHVRRERISPTCEFCTPGAERPERPRRTPRKPGHCKRGHPLDPDNVKLRHQGDRIVRVCGICYRYRVNATERRNRVLRQLEKAKESGVNQELLEQAQDKMAMAESIRQQLTSETDPEEIARLESDYELLFDEGRQAVLAAMEAP